MVAIASLLGVGMIVMTIMRKFEMDMPNTEDEAQVHMLETVKLQTNSAVVT